MAKISSSSYFCRLNNCQNVESVSADETNTSLNVLTE